jgi:DNA-binding MarR family transcriptional regulator
MQHCIAISYTINNILLTHLSRGKSIFGINKLIHEPARLAIMTALSSCSSADFTFLLQLTGLTKGNLSSHLSKLEEGKMIQIEKHFENKMPRTMVSLTEKGRQAIIHHWQLLDQLRQWQPDKNQ